MLGHRELTVQDYLGMLKRRFWLILASAVLFLAIGFGISHFLPSEYVSQTLVLIEQQKVPENYVKPVVTEDLGQRLASMQEQILSRSRIEPIVTKFNLFAGSNNTMDDRVDLTRKAIGIAPIRSDQVKGTNGMPGFFISFKAQDAHTAQQVCGEITSLFVSENLSAREQSAVGTTDFLKQQLADSKRNLDEQDAKFAAFQQKYFGKLPEQQPSNANTLQALTTQLDATTQSLNRMQQDETFLQALISEQTHEQQGTELGSGISLDEREKELKTLTEQKQALETLYTADHPDVVAISRRISDLRAEIAHASAKPASSTDATTVTQPDPPRLVQLKAQLRAVQQSIANTKQEQDRIGQQVRTYEARIESSPMVEEEYKQLTRDHDTALQFYNSLQNKMNESSMATALEQRQQGEQFHVMDAPNLPDAPTFPNPFLFAGGGFALGLFLGVGVAALLEYRDTSLRNERDIWAFTKLPTLAIISHIDGLPQPPKVRKFWNPFSRSNKPIESVGL
jgi:polysaccharide chain length determinant protein (PEP-CTERM system associated)